MGGHVSEPADRIDDHVDVDVGPALASRSGDHHDRPGSRLIQQVISQGLGPVRRIDDRRGSCLV
jgi:hypothetical protein